MSVEDKNNGPVADEEMISGEVRSVEEEITDGSIAADIAGDPDTEDMSCDPNEEEIEASEEDMIPGTEEDSEPSAKKRIPAVTIFLSALCVLLATALVLTQLGVIGTIRQPKGLHYDGFSTPEETIRYFIESVRDERFEDAGSVFVTSDNSPGASFKGQLLLLGSYTPSRQYYMPEKYPKYDTIHMMIEEGQSAKNVLGFTSSILLGDLYHNENPLSTDAAAAEQQIADYEMLLNPELLGKMEFLRADLLAPEYQNSADYEASLKSRLTAFGYERYAEYITLVNFGEEKYISFFAMVNVEGKWKIHGLYSQLAGIDYAIAVPISEADYLSLLA
ncbi:MAG: hypothetical protein GX099_03195 [Clostridiaceae bacterium]|jgi:hypothetical protein|nr:hypothetical protein [Oscillospiraceae bacterium]NLO62419.1 hypothetical protein [Clostridiaceae bacterium]